MNQTDDYAIMYFYKENEDQWTYNRRGPEREIIVRIHENVPFSDISDILPNIDRIDKAVKPELEKMVKRGVRSHQFTDPNQ